MDSNGSCLSWIMTTWAEAYRRMVAQASRLRHHALVASAPLVIAQVLCLSANGGDDGLLLYYPCDDKSGTVLHDAGPYHKDGSLNAVVNGEERGVSIVCKKTGEWVPIINADGIQRKGIVPGSDSALAEGERPIVLDRDKDYTIDITNGLIKAIDGGRVKIDKPFTLDFRFTNPGPKWEEGKKGGGLKLDGFDDFATLGSIPTNQLLAATIQLWVKISKNCSTNTIMLQSGSEAKSCTLGLMSNTLFFLHRPVYDSLFAAFDRPLTREQWHHLAAARDGTSAVLYIDGKMVGRDIAGGKFEINGPLRIGGVHDPYFLGATVDEIKIYNRAKTAEEIAKDAAQ